MPFAVFTVPEAMSNIPYTSEPHTSDERDTPKYTPAEAAAYLELPPATVKSWIYGRKYRNPPRVFEPLVTPAGTSERLLSFFNLAELHILSVCRRVHGLKMRNMRKGIEYVKREFPSNHPLLTYGFYTEGRDLFVKLLEGQTVNTTRQGQLGLREILDFYLERIVWDEKFKPKKIYPVIGTQGSKAVSIIATVSSGRPIVDGFGVPVASIWSRYQGGETIPFIAEDYEIPADLIKGAIEYCEASTPI